MNRLAVYLNRHIDGVVYSSPNILSAKSTDRSPLSYYPRLVATPVHSLDVRRLLRFSYQLAHKNIQLPISVRGAGLDKGAADLSTGLVIDTSKLNRIQEIDTIQRLVRVQVGVRLGELKNALILQGLDFPVIGDSRETIGDLIARGALAYRNAQADIITSFIANAEVVYADGSIAELKSVARPYLKFIAKHEDFNAEVHQSINRLYDQNFEQFEQYDALHDRAGYSGLADVRTRTNFNLIPLLCGAENSLAVVTEVILRVESIFDQGERVAVVCRNSHEYVKASRALRSFGFTDLFVYDTELFNEVENTGKASRFFRKASDDGYMIVAYAKDDAGLRRYGKIAKLKRELGRSMRVIEENEENTLDFDCLPQNLDAYLNDSSRNNFRTPLVDGVYVPIEQQVRFLNGVIKLSDEFSCKLAIYGYPDFDSFSLRPDLSTKDAEGRRKLLSFMRRYLDLVYECGGNPCGEAAEGRWLPIFMNRYRSAERMALDGRVKEIFDPCNILAPGIKQQADAKSVLRHFRTERNCEIISSN